MLTLVLLPAVTVSPVWKGSAGMDLEVSLATTCFSLVVSLVTAIELNSFGLLMTEPTQYLFLQCLISTFSHLM